MLMNSVTVAGSRSVTTSRSTCCSNTRTSCAKNAACAGSDSKTRRPYERTSAHTRTRVRTAARAATRHSRRASVSGTTRTAARPAANHSAPTCPTRPSPPAALRGDPGVGGGRDGPPRGARPPSGSWTPMRCCAIINIIIINSSSSSSNNLPSTSRRIRYRRSSLNWPPEGHPRQS